MESYVKSLIKHQQKMGHEVEVLTLNKVFHGGQGALPDREILDGIPVRRVSFIGRRRFFIPLVSPFYFKRYDIVHVHNTDVFFDMISLLARVLRFPIFATTHGGFFHTEDFSGIKKIYFNLITRISCQGYRGIIASSQHDYDVFKDTNKNVLLMENAVEVLGTRVADGPDFIYLGRLAPHKGVPNLIATHGLLKKKYGITAKLHIVGPEWGVSIKDLSAAAEAAGVSDLVVLHGAKDPAEMEDILKACGFYVSASTYEGFGMSMLEAMTVGMIPFVYPNESFSQLIEQAQVGRCVNFDQHEKAADQIHEAAGKITPQDRQKSQAFSEKFSWHELARKITNSYMGQ